MAYTPYVLEPLGACCAACASGRSCSGGAPLGDISIPKVGLLLVGVVVASLLLRKKSR